jgi:hypothetical protein
MEDATTKAEKVLAFTNMVVHSDIKGALAEDKSIWGFLTDNMIKEDARLAFRAAAKVLEERDNKPTSFKVVLCDGDGVLSGHDPTIWKECQVIAPGVTPSDVRVHPMMVGRLKAILDATGAKLVISSLWKERYMESLVAYLEDHGIPEDRIIGRTPSMQGGAFRQREIQAWLAAHSEVTSFVILDDSLVWNTKDPRFVMTNFRHGLQPKDVVKAINALEGFHAAQLA